MNYNKKKLQRLLRSAVYLSLETDKFGNEPSLITKDFKRVEDGTYKLWKGEAEFIKDFIGLDSEGYVGQIEVRNGKIISMIDCNKDILHDGVFATKQDTPEANKHEDWVDRWLRFFREAQV